MAWLLDRVAQWPPWSLYTFAGLSLCLVLLHVVEKTVFVARCESKASPDRSEAAPEREGKPCGKHDASTAFPRFQRQYLSVYCLVMFADWLQGTHMYSLYQSYGLNVGALFLTGFLSSAVFGNFVGPIVDNYGRRNACLVYCLLEIVINLLENVNSMAVLLVGRVLGGISTALLFCAFESWMVTEHKARGYDQQSLARTFANASEANGVLAVVAGLVAQVAADAMGHIGPFRLAVVVTALAALLVLDWPENYGLEFASSKKTQKQEHGSNNNMMNVYALGLAYSLFEGAMYVFVFLWYPTLEAIAPRANVPGGLVFSIFMVSIAVGGKLFGIFQRSLGEEALGVAVVSVATLSLTMPMFQANFWWIFGGFVLFEVCVGMFAPCCAALRSRHFPSERLSTTLGFFRLPTNVLVVLGTGAESYMSSHQLFCGCCVVLAAATFCAAMLARGSTGNSKTKTR